MNSRIRFDIRERTPFADGHEFGRTGAYERLCGRIHFAVDPTAPAQAGIVDLALAPRNADGRLECAADFMILKPRDARRGNRRLFFDYGNRGNKRALQFFCDAPAGNDPTTRSDAGNGFLFERGYTVAWCAWQGGLLPGDGRLILDVPVACDGQQPITGKTRVEYIVNQPGVTTFPLSSQVSTRSYPTVDLDTRSASLTRRRYADDPRQAVAPDLWCFGRVEGGRGLDNRGDETAIVPSDRHIHLYAGFEPGWIYELVYTARDPLVLGLGHLVVRDFVSFLRHRAEDDVGVANPLWDDAGGVAKAYAWGRSQTGRCIRDFLYEGFNADAEGRRVFDGVMPHVAGAGRMWLNHRFANPVSPPGQQYEQRFSVVDRFPFAYASSTDHLTGRTDAILKRPDTDPLVLHTQSATEYWQRRGSLVHTDTQGNDLDQPANVRVYSWTSSQHFADPNLRAPTRGVCQNLTNPVQTSMLCRALLVALDRWASEGTAPPPSRVPTRADGTLVDYAEWRDRCPSIPAVAIPREPASLPLLDWGDRLDDGILDEPPAVDRDRGYVVLVPTVDADGNELGGVRAPMVQAPLGTYTGWNLRARGFGAGALYYDAGSYVPFPDTPEERRMTADPRPAVLDRYDSPEAYGAAIRTACEALVAERFMLAEDIPRSLEIAADWGRPLHDVRL